MYSRKKGKAGSKKPHLRSKATWVRYNAKEIELLASKLAKEGKSGSQIGLHLRDTYGVPDTRKSAGKKITAILKDKNILPEVPEDLISLIKRSVLIKKHLSENHKDMGAKRGLQLTESKINSLIKYYKRTGRLSPGWSYDADNVKILIS